MIAFVLSILLVIASQVTYQLAVKAMPDDSNPFAALVIVYGLAMLACMALAPLAGKPVVLADAKRLLDGPSCLLALAVVGIETGYLLAYRNGWTLGTTFAVAGASSVALLALVGVAWFGESLDARRVSGIALALAGGWLIVARN